MEEALKAQRDEKVQSMQASRFSGTKFTDDAGAQERIKKQEEDRLRKQEEKKRQDEEK